MSGFDLTGRVAVVTGGYGVLGGTMADDSRWWAERIDQPGPHSDVRHQLAATATAVAGRLAAAGPGAAAEADEALRALRWDVFARMRLLVLAGAGANAPRAPPAGSAEPATYLKRKMNARIGCSAASDAVSSA